MKTVLVYILALISLSGCSDRLDIGYINAGIKTCEENHAKPIAITVEWTHRSIVRCDNNKVYVFSE